jgi:hypothetical protein
MSHCGRACHRPIADDIGTLAPKRVDSGHRGMHGRQLMDAITKRTAVKNEGGRPSEEFEA